MIVAIVCRLCLNGYIKSAQGRTNMAAGDRKSNGKPKDIVIHHCAAHGLPALCGRTNAGCISLGVVADVTCLRCLRKINADHRVPN